MRRGGRALGAIEDRGTTSASGGAVTLDASEVAFSPTCVEAGAGETITVEVTLPDSGPVSFVRKYHAANGIQGAFLVG